MEIPDKLAAEMTHGSDNSAVQTANVADVCGGNYGDLKLGACGITVTFKLWLHIN